jgi:hypothetical protein
MVWKSATMESPGRFWLKIVRNANLRPDAGAVNSPAMNQVSDWQCGCTPSAPGKVNSGSPGTRSNG